MQLVYISEMWKIVEAIAENADTAQWEILNNLRHRLFERDFQSFIFVFCNNSQEFFYQISTMRNTQKLRKFRTIVIELFKNNFKQRTKQHLLINYTWLIFWFN